MNQWQNQSKVFREARKSTGLSQVSISKKLGWQCGQFVSNIERGQCGIPPKKIGVISEILNINPDSIKTAMVIDYSNYIKGQ